MAKQEANKYKETLRVTFLKAAEDFLYNGVDADEEGYAVLKSKYERLVLVMGDSEEDFQENEYCHDIFAKIQHHVKTKLSASSLVAVQTKTKLPRLEIIKYDVNPRSWISFWAQFEVIHTDRSLSREEKYRYLLLTLKEGTKARKIVEGYPPNAENYDKAVESLKTRFGCESTIIEVYTRDLLAIVLSKTKPNLGALYDTLNSKIRALDTLGVTTSNVAAVLYPLVQSALPAELARDWERQRTKDEESFIGGANPLQSLMSFLEQEVLAEERLSLSFAKSTTIGTTKNQVELATAATASALSTQAKSYNCIFCSSPKHKNYMCQKVSELSLEERKEKIKSARCCFKCLSYGHHSRQCHVKVACAVCKQNHSTILHQEKEQKEIAMYAGQCNQDIYLKTIMIMSNNVVARVLLDDGSSRSYIKESLAKKLKLKSVGTERTAHSLFGGVTIRESVLNVYNVQISDINNKYVTELSCLGIKNLCCDIPRISDEGLLRQLEAKGVYLTDIQGGCGGPEIEMLIGAQHLGSLLTDKTVILKCGVTAIQTKLGWCVLGAKPSNNNSSISMAISNMCLFSIDQPMWSLESLGIEGPTIESSKNEAADALVEFEKTICVNTQGRYEVSLPWRAGHPPLPDHHKLAEARLRSVTEKLKGNYSLYDNVFKNWLDDGIIEKVSLTEEVPGNKIHYLPHRPVFRPGHESTPCRPVFDASAKQQKGISLNECLLTGPNQIREIPEVLTRFRAGAIGVTSDIKSAFLQIFLKSTDRDSLRFLWWTDPSCQKMTIYRHTRVVFGVSSSPFLLIATINHHLNLEKFKVPELQDTIDKLKKSFYCDDCIASVNSEHELLKFVSQSAAVLSEGGFELRKWAHNGYSEVDPVKSVLGLRWELNNDTLSCSNNFADVNGPEVTKRGLLSVINRIFDPIGILAPALLIPKLLMQACWKEKQGWDDPLPDDVRKRFLAWYKYVDDIKNCVIPRWVHHGPTSMQCCEFHVFADGSGMAYACVVYNRCTFQGHIGINFVAAKARVNPMTKLTIPRTELMAALIAVRFVKGLHIPSNVPIFYYSDSTVALAWITHDVVWKTWVGNRVAEIRQNTTVGQWRHVDGTSNPADLPSRGCDFNFLAESGWLSGPQWLLRPASQWPCRLVSKSIPGEALSEGQSVNLINVETEIFSEQLLSYFSSYTKIWRMVGWMLRFVNNTSSNCVKRSGPLSASELMEAEKRLFRIVQREAIVENMFPNLQIEMGDDNILRVKTRLDSMENIDEEFLRPILLVDHGLVQKMIKFVHVSNSHAGVTTILSLLRERIWLCRGRQIIKKVINSCLKCKRYTVSNITTRTAPLPSQRLSNGFPFQTTGVDLAGPLFLKGMKAWIVLFTCAVYRAVHLELVTALSTEAFLMALRRFFARRGRCITLWSDQGTNFQGAEALFGKLNWDQIVDECAIQRVEWRFNPASAPWWGGWWERLVGVVKNSIKKTLGKACLNYEEMLTVLADIEGVVNRRPLTYFSCDADEIVPLSPWDFICAGGAPHTNDIDIIDRTSLLKRVAYLQTVRTHLRERFRNEYIGALRSRPQKERGEINPGDVVLLGSDNLKRVMWPLAKVIDIMPSADGVIRVVRLQLQGSQLIRPVQRVFPLEISGDLEGSNINTDGTNDNVINNLTSCDDVTIDDTNDLMINTQNVIDNDLSHKSVIDTPDVNDTLEVRTRCGRKINRPKKLDM